MLCAWSLIARIGYILIIFFSFWFLERSCAKKNPFVSQNKFWFIHSLPHSDVDFAKITCSHKLIENFNFKLPISPILLRAFDFFHILIVCTFFKLSLIQIYDKSLFSSQLYIFLSITLTWSVSSDEIFLSDIIIILLLAVSLFFHRLLNMFLSESICK